MLTVNFGKYFRSFFPVNTLIRRRFVFALLSEYCPTCLDFFSQNPKKNAFGYPDIDSNRAIPINASPLVVTRTRASEQQLCNNGRRRKFRLFYSRRVIRIQTPQIQISQKQSWLVKNTSEKTRCRATENLIFFNGTFEGGHWTPKIPLATPLVLHSIGESVPDKIQNANPNQIASRFHTKYLPTNLIYKTGNIAVYSFPILGVSNITLTGGPLCGRTYQYLYSEYDFACNVRESTAITIDGRGWVTRRWYVAPKSL